jgi:uncharacterized protein (DUF58 family)
MVKVFDPDRSRSSAKTIWVALDMCQFSQAGTGIQSTEEYAVTITASLLKKYIENGWPVGLITKSERQYIFPTGTGNQHLETMTTALATMKAEGQVPIEQIVATEASRFDLNTMLIVVTPSWNESLVSPLIQIKDKQGVVVVVLLDPRSFGEATCMENTPRSLMLNGVQVYIVKTVII